MRFRSGGAAVLILALLFCAPASALAPGEGSHSGVEGRILFRGVGLEGARVRAYRDFDTVLAHRPFAVSSPADGDGAYRLNLPPGAYYLVAGTRSGSGEDGPAAPGDRVAYHGANPISVSPGRYTHVGFLLVAHDRPTAYEPGDDPASGAIAGVVLLDGKPLRGVQVSLYVDGGENLRAAPYAAAAATGEDGGFRFDSLAPLDYFVVARKRASGKGSGPLADGDYFGYYPANPLAVQAGKTARIELPVVNKAGEVGGEESIFQPTGTALRGRVADGAGKPVRGVYVFAYEEKEMGHKRPAAISGEVDGEGRYVLHLPKGGRYYIGARSLYGDTPALGEWYGRWEGTGDHSLVIETGREIGNVDIVVEKILP
jgi:hypothetical protein